MAKKAQNNRGMTFPPEILTRDELIALLGTFSKTSSTGLRNRALIVILWRAGLRISEALDLFLKDIDLEAQMLRVLHGKGNKFRTVGIDGQALEVLQVWIERWRALGFDWRNPIFCTTRGRRLSSSYVRQMLPRQARRAGITKRVHAHGLRHTMAAELIAEGAALHLIRDQLGHANASITDHYLRRVKPEQLIDHMKERTW